MGLFDWYDERKHIEAIASSKPLDGDLKTSLQKYVERNYGKPYITQEEKEKKATEERRKKQELERKRREEEQRKAAELERKRLEKESKKQEQKSSNLPKEETTNETSHTGGGIKFSIDTSGARYSVSSDVDRDMLSSDADDFFGSYDNFRRINPRTTGYNNLNNLFGNIPGYKPPKRFQDYLTEYINRSGMTNVEVYKRANLSKSVFSSIFADYNRIPKKSTVVALALALKLDLKDTETLLMKAGYTFSNSIIADLVVVYFINKKKYDIDEINRALFELKQPVLGSKSY